MMGDRLASGEAVISRLFRTRFAGDVSRLASFNLLSALISFGQGLLVARWLGPTEYGVAALVMNYPYVLFGLLDARTGSATVRYVARFRHERRADKVLALCKMAYLLDLGIAASTVVVVWFSAEWAESHIVHREGYAFLIVLFAIGLVPRAFTSTSMAVFSVLSRFRVSGWLELSTAILRAVVTLGLVKAGAGVSGVVVGGVMASAFSGVVSAALCHRMLIKEHSRSWITARLPELRTDLKEILRFVAFTDLTELLSVLVKQLDLMMLGYFCGPREAGLYRLAKSFASSIGLAVFPLQSVIYPRMASPASEKVLETILLSVTDFAKRWGMLALVFMGGSIYWAPILFVYLAGPQYEPMIWAARVLLVCYMFWFLLFWLRPYYYGQGLVGQWTRGTVIYSLSFLGLAPPLSYTAGALGMAVAVSAVTVGFYLLMLRPFASVAISGK
jgi:O-antigen/teichoic acid export membrane protein